MMMRNLLPAALAASLLACGGVHRPAEAADPAKVKAPQTERNKTLVLDFFRVVFKAQNADAAKDYLTADYIQHNPTVPTGRDGFISTFKAMWKAPKPVEPTLRHPPEKVMAEGDLVTVMWKLQRRDPADSTKTYESFWFDMFRVADGKLAEHWDNDTK